MNPQVREDYKLQQSLQQEPVLLPVMEVSQVQHHQQKMVDSLPDFEDDSFAPELGPLTKQLVTEQKERKTRQSGEKEEPAIEYLGDKEMDKYNWRYL